MYFRSGPGHHRVKFWSKMQQRHKQHIAFKAERYARCEHGTIYCRNGYMMLHIVKGTQTFTTPTKLAQQFFYCNQNFS